jgi:aminopeptidase N
MEYAHDLIKDYTSGSIYIPDEEINESERIFDFRLSYKKGAAILHMLRYELDNDDLFFQILREFLSKYSFGNATADNFKTVLEEVSGRDFNLFFKEWYYGHGYPQIGINWYQEADTLYVVNNQSTTAPDETELFHINLQYKLVTASSDAIVIHHINQKSDTLKLFIPDKIIDIQVDPGHYILMEVLNIEKVEKKEQL